VGRLHEGLRDITDGLTSGEQVVVSGLQRVRPGGQVQPKMVEMPIVGQPRGSQTGGGAASIASGASPPTKEPATSALTSLKKPPDDEQPAATK
jgi:multidrug efflux system membrane fusion protein